jgi:hypothetical protein
MSDEKPEYDSHGRQMRDNLQHAKDLAYCVEHGWTEDALQHALHLVERLRHQCRRQCRKTYGDKKRDKLFTVRSLRSRSHVESSYAEYRKWLKRTGQTEIEMK